MILLCETKIIKDLFRSNENKNTSLLDESLASEIINVSENISVNENHRKSSEINNLKHGNLDFSKIIILDEKLSYSTKKIPFGNLF